MPKQSSNWPRVSSSNRQRNHDRLPLRDGLLIAKQSPGDISEIVRALKPLSLEERRKLSETMFRVLEHGHYSSSLDVRVGAVNTVLAMPSQAIRRLRQILSKRSANAVEVQFTVFVFLPSAVAALPAKEAVHLEKLRKEYLRRPGAPSFEPWLLWRKGWAVRTHCRTNEV